MTPLKRHADARRDPGGETAAEEVAARSCFAAGRLAAGQSIEIKANTSWDATTTATPGVHSPFSPAFLRRIYSRE